MTLEWFLHGCMDVLLIQFFKASIVWFPKQHLQGNLEICFASRQSVHMDVDAASTPNLVSPFPASLPWKWGVGWPVGRKQKPAGVCCVCFAFLREGTEEAAPSLPFSCLEGDCVGCTCILVVCSQRRPAKKSQRCWPWCCRVAKPSPAPSTSWLLVMREKQAFFVQATEALVLALKCFSNICSLLLTETA